MTNEDLYRIVEEEGWGYLLMELKPTEVSDIAVREALTDVQEAFKYLVSVLPDADLDLDDTFQLELDFG